MNHIAYVEKNTYKVALLIKESSFNPKEIKENYPIDWDNSICFSLAYENNKAPVKLIKTALGSILKACKSLGVTTLLVADVAYFKVLVKASKAESLYGSVCECVLGDFKVILAPNWQALFFNPQIQSKIDLAVNTLKNHLSGTHVVMGTGIIHFEEYPTGAAIQTWLQKLQNEPMLVCDTETTSLSVMEAELVSISFAWSQHEGIAFLVKDKQVLRDFFENYQGILTYHQATYDISVLCHQLYMKHDLDYEGLLQGLDALTKNIEDTKIIAYLATNSCAGNELGLKKLALEYAGNYGVLSEDVTALDIPPEDLLKYNLTDTLATYYVYNKYKPVMIQDDQLEIYQTIMLPSIRSIVHMQLIGMPMDKEQIHKTDKELTSIQKKWLKQLSKSKLVKDYEWKLQQKAFIKKNQELKVKYISIDNFKTTLNPNSGLQLIGLLYGHLGFEVINTTDSGLPSTDGDTLEALYNQLIYQYQIIEEELE
jgi:DNA polymerase-1